MNSRRTLFLFSLLFIYFSRGHSVGILIKCWCLPRCNKLNWGKWNCPSQEHVVLIFYSGVYLLQTQHPHFLPIWPIRRTIINLELFFGFSLFLENVAVQFTCDNRMNTFIFPKFKFTCKRIQKAWTQDQRFLLFTCSKSMAGWIWWLQKTENR